MKSIFLAAAAMIAVPAIAQEQPAGTADQTASGTATQGSGTMSTTGDPATQTPSTGGTTTSGSTGGMATTSGSTGGTTSAASSGSGMTGSGDPAAADPAGGYQPSTPPIQGSPAPGATVRFQAAPDPNTAFPPPPPMQKYPVCKKGQYDNCIQRGGK